MAAGPGLKPYRTIQTGPTSDAFREGWERLFGRKPEPLTEEQKQHMEAALKAERLRIEREAWDAINGECESRRKDESPDAPKT